MLQGPGSPEHTNVELFEEYEGCLQRLERLLDQAVENKCRLWGTLRASVIGYEEFERILEAEVSLAGQIEALYESMLERGLESAKLWDLMLNYAKFIAENPELETRVKRRCGLDSRKDAVTGKEENQAVAAMRRHFDSETCAALRVSADKESFGRIEWYSKNLPGLYGDAKWDPKGQSVSVFLPEQFRDSHEKTLVEWFHAPTPVVLEKTNHFLLELSNGRVKSCDLSVRVLPLQGNVQTFVLLEVVPSSSEYIVLDEDLRMINRPGCLSEIMKVSKLGSKQLHFGLLAAELVDLDWSLIPRNATTPIEFDLSCPDSYEELLREYLNEAEEIKKRTEDKQAVLSLRRYYVSRLQRSHASCSWSFSGQAKVIRWSSGREFLAIHVSDELAKAPIDTLIKK